MAIISDAIGYAFFIFYQYIWSYLHQQTYSFIYDYFTEYSDFANLSVIREAFFKPTSDTDNQDKDENMFIEIIRHLEALNKIMVVGEDIYLIWVSIYRSKILANNNIVTAVFIQRP